MSRDRDEATPWMALGAVNSEDPTEKHSETNDQTVSCSNSHCDCEVTC